jgi:hypothetical protein
LSFHSSVRKEKRTPSGDAMPLSPEQETLCERLEKGESMPSAATLIRQQAREIDDLWDRLSRAYALVRKESPAEMVQEEMKEIHAMFEGRRNGVTYLSRIGQGKTKGEES